MEVLPPPQNKEICLKRTPTYCGTRIAECGIEQQGIQSSKSGNEQRVTNYAVSNPELLQVRIDIPEYGLQAFFSYAGLHQFLPLFDGQDFLGGCGFGIEHGGYFIDSPGRLVYGLSGLVYLGDNF